VKPGCEYCIDDLQGVRSKLKRMATTNACHGKPLNV
jgi:hypothetical protein